MQEDEPIRWEDQPTYRQTQSVKPMRSLLANFDTNQVANRNQRIWRGFRLVLEENQTRLTGETKEKSVERFTKLFLDGVESEFYE